MNRERKIVLIALGVLLALVVALILILTVRRGPSSDLTITPEMLAITAPEGATAPPATEAPSEEELGQQAMSEEGEEPHDYGALVITELPQPTPID